MDFITVDELQTHSSFNDCWVSIFGEVFDITEFISKHPGGASVFLGNMGKDITLQFRNFAFN